MIQHHLEFGVGINQLRPGSANPPTSVDDFRTQRLVWGTRGSGWVISGRYNDQTLSANNQVNVITDRPRHFYKDTYQNSILAEMDAHSRARRPVWIARGLGYGMAGLGVVVAAFGVTSPLGVAMIVKGALIGSAAGIVTGTGGGLYHTNRSTLPYAQQLMFMHRLDDLIDVLVLDEIKPWMLSNKEVCKTRAVAPEVFDHVMVELRMAGAQLGTVIDTTAAWQQLRELGINMDPNNPPPAYLPRRDEAQPQNVETPQGIALQPLTGNTPTTADRVAAATTTATVAPETLRPRGRQP